MANQDYEFIFNSFNSVIKNLLLSEAHISNINISKDEQISDTKPQYVNVLINSLSDFKTNFLFSFEKELITKIFDEYTKELNLGDDINIDEYLKETGMDFANIILGHMLKYFKSKIKPKISIPLITNNINTNKKSNKIIVETNYGKLILYFYFDYSTFDINSFDYFDKREIA